VLLDPIGGILFIAAADLADHHHRVGVGILMKSFSTSMCFKPLTGSPRCPPRSIVRGRVR